MRELGDSIILTCKPYIKKKDKRVIVYHQRYKIVELTSKTNSYLLIKYFNRYFMLTYIQKPKTYTIKCIT